ncbi:MFS transporter (plasmid) [Acidiphilium multivorum]|uniref:MFS transporter n=1 Tax=Acidiphilium multivorum TaxID=62140 RepID=UPI001F4BD03A|nr:MFS transporter [Acidiphilium multivorum]UNC16533.1 MFS transporter [Acidiphilium multivorum]
MNKRFRWVIVSLIVALVLINYIDRVAIAFAAGPLMQAIGISKQQFGFISGAFSVGYLLVALLSGPLVDRFGPKKVLATAIIIWSLASALTSMVGTFAMLLIVRILLGVGEGPGFPSASHATSRWLPKHERGLVLSLIGGVGVAGSLLIAGPILSHLIAHVGWRGMFITLGCVGLAWVCVWLIVFKDSPELHFAASAEERQYISAGQVAEEKRLGGAQFDSSKLFSNLTLWMVALGFFSWGYIFWGLMYWFPTYLGETYKLNLEAVGWFSVVPWGCGIVGSLIGGLVMDSVQKRTGKMRLTYVIMGFAVLLSGMCMIPVFLFHSLTIALVFISLGVGFGFVTAGFWWVGAIEAAPDQPGFAAGIVDACFGISGIVAPIIMGTIVQHTHSFQNGFLVMVFAGILGALGLIFFTRENPHRLAREAMS